MQTYARLFGTGPRGLAISLTMLAGAGALEETLGWPAVHGHAEFGAVVFGISIVITLMGMGWSLQSLPVESRGRDLITTGAFRYARHPLYASVLLSFDFGLALYLDNWLYVAWAVVQLPLWHVNVIGEERLMHREFGDAYTNYCRNTGRFLPK